MQTPDVDHERGTNMNIFSRTPKDRERADTIQVETHTQKKKHVIEAISYCEVEHALNGLHL